ncbi:AAA family ATPase [Leptospira sp. 96542]|nr:AAA family ATPase [Leptospira sp. 96542]
MVPKPMANPKANFESILKSLESNGKESEVDAKLVIPLIEFLGYAQNEYQNKPRDGEGGEADFVLYLDDSPFIIIESKSNQVNLSDVNGRAYKLAKKQLFGYMKSKNLHSSEYGVLINGKNVQVFQRKENFIYPLTPIISLSRDANKVFSNLKKTLQKPKKYIKQNKTIIVTVYNNKGGVGKTVTTGNLAGVLSNMGRSVLLVDLDPQQRDLTDSFGYKSEKNKTSIFDILFQIKLESDLSAKKIKDNLFLIAGDERFDDPNLAAKKVTPAVVKKFKKVLEAFTKKKLFDYILIDCPTNWSFFSKTGVSVADAVLLPVNYQAAQAIHNAVQVLDKFLPEVWLERSGTGPEVLPILFNNAYTDETSQKHFKDVKRDEIRKLTKDKWYEDLFESNLEIKHHHEIATNLFLYLNEDGPSPYTIRKPNSKITKEYEEVAKVLFGVVG